MIHRALEQPVVLYSESGFHCDGSRRVSGRCFVTDGRRLILPAFGAFTGGLDVLNPALARLLRPRFRIFLLGNDRVLTFDSTKLKPPPAWVA